MPFDSKFIQSLLDDLESDRSERTRSVNDTDKFGQAICAFANDLPGNGKPGHLIIGAEDKTGKVLDIAVTDRLLKNLSAIRTDGNIQPQPSMVVDYSDLEGGRVAVVEVQPSHFPPIRYKGKIWVRVGPRKGIANEQDEKILLERRNSQALTFDAHPCFRATVQRVEDDLIANGNGMPQFDLTLGTAFKVIEYKPNREETESGQKVDRNETEKETEESGRFVPSLSETHRKIYHFISVNPKIKYSELQNVTGMSRSYLSKVVAFLKEQGYIVRRGSDREGEWQVLKSLTQQPRNEF